MSAKVSQPVVHFLQEEPKLKPVFQDLLVYSRIQQKDTSGCSLSTVCPRSVRKINPTETSFFFDQEDTGLGGGKEGAILRAQQKKGFGVIPYFLVIADYEKAFLYVALKQFLSNMDELTQQINFKSVLLKQNTFKSILPKQNTFFKSVLEIQNNFRSVLPKTLSVPPKQFCVLALKIQNNLYSHSIYELSMSHHESDDPPCPPLPCIMPPLPQPPPPLLPLPPPPSPQQ